MFQLSGFYFRWIELPKTDKGGPLGIESMAFLKAGWRLLGLGFRV